MERKKKVYCDLRLCLGCRSCEIACAVEHSQAKELFKALKEKQGPKKRVKLSASPTQPVPVRCQHCDPAPCVLACMSGGMSKDPKTGKTVHDPEKCVGCWMCVMVCPFGAIHRSPEEKIIFKCDLCPDREIPACVEACPTKALFVGTFEEFKKRVAGKKVSKAETHGMK